MGARFARAGRRGSGPSSLAQRLLAWYDESRRKLPWRETADPYRIWVSEIMLQQTTVRAAVPYYEAFLERFPDVRTLAEAPLDDVLARWSGLGYYSRARNLKRAAEIVARDHGGRVPGDPDALRALPGVGAYTAGAILSIAFGRPEPVLDGNVTRVLTRLFTLRGDATRAPLRNGLWDLARRLVPADRPGDFNQALMELGATVCTPRAPSCGTCPVAPLCRANATGKVAEYPTPRSRPPAVAVRMAVALVERRGALLMLRRREGRLLRDLLELPGGEIPLAGDAGEHLARVVLARHGLSVAVGAERARVRHGIMNRRIIVVAHAARLARPGRPLPPDAAWVQPAQIASCYGVGGIALKVLARIGSPVSPCGTPGRARA
jgi:A/G-specific adenine glycosylase